MQNVFYILYSQIVPDCLILSEYSERIFPKILDYSKKCRMFDRE